MRVLVTGCSAFLGDAVADALRQRNHSVIATASTARAGVSALDARDADAVDERVSSADAVVHLAAIRAYGDPARTAHATDVIVAGTAAVVAAARRRAVPVVIAGSGEEYGAEAPVPYREDGVYAPTSEYGRAKRRAVVEALAAYREGVCVLRPSTVYGPRQPSFMLVAQCVRAAVADDVVRINGGEQRRDHVYVTDAAEAFALAIENASRIRGQQINIASGDARSVRFVAERVLSIAGRGRLDVGPASTRAGDVMEASFDVERAATALGWTARTAIDEGLARCVSAALAGG